MAVKKNFHFYGPLESYREPKGSKNFKKNLLNNVLLGAGFNDDFKFVILFKKIFGKKMISALLVLLQLCPL